ncbi:MAG: YihY/virulence factor BrkB family protein [Mycobacterium sp.]|nr:YihY/virulence factor BrkB family protein [Mycobacterium sp.]
MTNPLARLRSRYPWLNHAVRSQQRYDDAQGDFYAAGLSYFTLFAIFPLLMVGFAVVGFVLANRPRQLDEIDTRVKAAVPGEFGEQIIALMDAAIASRTSVGVIGLAAAL